MNISISQNFKNVLKNKIKILISPILYKSIDFIVDNLFEINNPDKYFYFMNTIQSSVKELIKNIVITAFEELDNNFKNSNNRTSRYIINKSNVSRTIITIVGEITFSRTYYIIFLEHTILINSLVINFSMLIIALIYLNMTTMIQL